MEPSFLPHMAVVVLVMAVLAALADPQVIAWVSSCSELLNEYQKRLALEVPLQYLCCCFGVGVVVGGAFVAVAVACVNRKMCGSRRRRRRRKCPRCAAVKKIFETGESTNTEEEEFDEETDGEEEEPDVNGAMNKVGKLIAHAHLREELREILTKHFRETREQRKTRSKKSTADPVKMDEEKAEPKGEQQSAIKGETPTTRTTTTSTPPAPAARTIARDGPVFTDFFNKIWAFMQQRLLAEYEQFRVKMSRQEIGHPVVCPRTQYLSAFEQELGSLSLARLAAAWRRQACEIEGKRFRAIPADKWDLGRLEVDEWGLRRQDVRKLYFQRRQQYRDDLRQRAIGKSLKR